MTRKNFALILLALAAAVPACSQHSLSEPVLDVSAMDRSVDPCVDLYTFSCGGWVKNNPIPPDQSSWGTYGKLEDENRAQLRTILEGAAVLKGTRDGITQKIGDYYASCIDEAAIEKLGVKPLLPELERIEGLQSKQDLAQYVATAQFPPSLGGGGTLFSFRSNQDFKDSTQFIAEVDQGGLGLPDRDYYSHDHSTSEALKKSCVAHSARLCDLLGDKPPDGAEEAMTVLRIETAL